MNDPAGDDIEMRRRARRLGLLLGLFVSVVMASVFAWKIWSV